MNLGRKYPFRRVPTGTRVLPLRVHVKRIEKFETALYRPDIITTRPKYVRESRRLKRRHVCSVVDVRVSITEEWFRDNCCAFVRSLWRRSSGKYGFTKWRCNVWSCKRFCYHARELRPQKENYKFFTREVIERTCQTCRETGSFVNLGEIHSSFRLNRE